MKNLPKQLTNEQLYGELVAAKEYLLMAGGKLELIQRCSANSIGRCELRALSLQIAELAAILENEEAKAARS